MKITLTHTGFACALGKNTEEIVYNLRNGNFDTLSECSGIKDEKVPYGMVKGIAEKTDGTMRCYALADEVLKELKEPMEELKKKYSPERIGIVVGSSNTGIHEAELAIEKAEENENCPKDFSFEQIELGSIALYLREKTGFKGPAYTISTACSSSAKAFRSARDLLSGGICDAVLTGGIDERCHFALNGFNSLETISRKRTLPMSENRDGINLGEGAALFIAEKDKDGIKIAGIGENSDAYHATHPDPSGKGAENAMRLALKDASLTPADIDYVNLHGTGTKANDAMESIAVYNVFGDRTIVASTKPLTGHTLGAAGAIEAALSWIMLKYDLIIPHIYDGNYGKDLKTLTLATGKEKKKIRRIISNSFAFGGSNASLILEK